MLPPVRYSIQQTLAYTQVSRRPTASVISLSVPSPMHYRQAYTHLIREQPVYQPFTLASHLSPEPSRWRHEYSSIDGGLHDDLPAIREVIVFAIFTADICIHVGIISVLPLHCGSIV